MSTHNQRRADRESAALPLRLGDEAAALTRDISASGVYFQTSSEQQVGGQVELELELQTPGGRLLTLRALGQIVRVDSVDGKTGVAVRLLSSKLLADEFDPNDASPAD